jgi:hypothetical protein
MYCFAVLFVFMIIYTFVIFYMIYYFYLLLLYVVKSNLTQCFFIIITFDLSNCTNKQTNKQIP